MSDFQLFVVVATGVLWFVFGLLFASWDICERGLYTPKDYYNYDGFNWFGSWFIFIFRTIIAFPFYILLSVTLLIKGWIEWLFTVGRED